ncbi:bromodomain-containing protein 8 isoform X2 [Ctenopharyngodon idella]|uniref:bromodomain-containing protein 8 isoform X2 n=1 Tax=Ctenopharyngodon idella TaxID=7959 RepID=UPI00222F49AF|nr:bromodomain-containing protein 8 isoform X2 [Ctenopharyngodon idella]
MQTLEQNDCWKIHTGYAHLHLIARHLSCQRSNRKQSSHDKMASGVGKHKLLLGPTEPWSIREKLCLASSVMKSGDQNWVSVSRAIKPFAEPGRPPDWFSQKHCASQYSELLETTEAPKRKRGEKGEVVETVEDVIVRRLTAERIEELKRLIKDTQEKHRKLKRETELIQAGHLDSKLEELWEEITRSRKQEEEEAEVKRKATDAAYKARQAVKNTPKRVPSVTVRSPSGACSPSLDFPIGDSSEDHSTTGAGSSVFVPLTELPGPGVVEASLGSLLDESTQKKLLGQKITPPPSPLLSELLKKGSLLPTSPRLAVEGESPSSQLTGSHDNQMMTSSLPASQAATGAPTLSRLLEAGPAQFPSQLSSLATADSAPSTATSAVDTAASLSTGGDGAPSASVDNKEAVLGEEDLVTVSYMAEELDLETVGDIIAIIEEKGDENAEALDAAAVEAALSLCEDTGHTLSGTWEPNPFRPIGPEPSSTSEDLDPHPLHLSEGKRDGSDMCGSSSGCAQGYPTSSTVPSVPQNPTPTAGAHSEPDTHRPEHIDEAQDGRPESLHAVIKSEANEWTRSQSDKQSEDDPVIKQHSKEVKEEEEAVSDAEEGSVSEIKAGLERDGAEDCGGEEDGDGIYLSEPEGETELDPPASESEDGYSMHTASSSVQLHTTADSIPSSPASSQFSICSEDQEAIQAQKIWKKAIMLVWRAAANHRYANVFLQPVTDDIAPGYHSIVHRPMDLSTIKKNIENGLIRTTAEFQRDIMLMFQNAVMYNSSDHDVFHMAVEMQRDVLEQIQQFLATQLIMQTSESGISAKSLRGREANRKQDPNDKDGGTRGRRCAIEADLKMKK